MQNHLFAKEPENKEEALKNKQNLFLPTEITLL